MCKLHNCENFHADGNEEDELQMNFTEDVYSDEEEWIDDDEDDCSAYMNDLFEMGCSDPEEEVVVETSFQPSAASPTD